MNPLVRLGLRIASLPIFDITKNYELLRRAQETFKPDIPKEEQDAFVLFDQYLLSNDGESHVPVRIFVPKNEMRNGLILFFHGGGFVTGNVETYTEPCARLATSVGRVVCSVDYGLAPENPFPDGLNDCLGVAREILDYFYSKDDPRLRPLTIMGDSAGGNLATVVTDLLHENGDHEADLQVLLYPAVGNDYSEDSPFASVEEKGEGFGLTRKNMVEYYQLYLPDPALLKDPRVSPLLIKDKSTMPPTLVVTCEHDLLRDEGEYYAEQLREAGVPVRLERMPDVPHGFFSNNAFFPEANEDLLDIIRVYMDNWEQ